jgi:hypothetical protein
VLAVTKDPYIKSTGLRHRRLLAELAGCSGRKAELVSVLVWPAENGARLVCLRGALQMLDRDTEKKGAAGQGVRAVKDGGRAVRAVRDKPVRRSTCISRRWCSSWA